MRTILAMSVLAAAGGMWTGCANSDLGPNGLSGSDNTGVQQNTSVQLGADSYSDTKVHFQNAFTDDKGKFRPDWAAGINCPTSHPRALAMRGDDVYSVSGAFNGDNARLDAKYYGPSPVNQDNTALVSNEPIVPDDKSSEPGLSDQQAARNLDKDAQQAPTERQPEVSDGRYGFVGDQPLPLPLTMEQKLRIFVDDKGKFRPDWAGGINTPPSIQQKADNAMLDNSR